MFDYDFDPDPPEKKQSRASMKWDKIKNKFHHEGGTGDEEAEDAQPGVIVDEETGKKGYVYRQMELPAENLTREFIEKTKKRIHAHVITEVASIDDAELVTELHNRAFLTAPDPYAAIEMRDMRRLIICPRTLVLVGMIWGSEPCGFIVCNFEEHCSAEEVAKLEALNKTGIKYKLLPEPAYKVGFISGLGVVPRWQRRGIGLSLGLHSWEYFKRYSVQVLRCEVFEGNDASYHLIKSMGFKETDQVVYWADGRLAPLRRL